MTTVMVIDDSQTMRKILSRMLIELGLSVSEAANGRDAVALLQEGPLPDLVLLDWRMPFMDGYEFLVRVRPDPVINPKQILMVTTEGGLKEITMALRAGADEYMLKPFTKEDLESKLALMGIL